MVRKPPVGAGLGFRRELIETLKAGVPESIRFFELALKTGREWAVARQDLRHFTGTPSLRLPRPPSPWAALAPRRNAAPPHQAFMAEHGMGLYTRTPSWCSDDAHLYDLLPIPFTGDAVRWVADRLRRAQDILEMKIGIENASYYVAPRGGDERNRIHLGHRCRSRLPAPSRRQNNIYVNSRNFGFDPLEFMTALPLRRPATSMWRGTTPSPTDCWWTPTAPR